MRIEGTEQPVFRSRTAMQKEVVLPAKRWSVLIDTTLLDKMCLCNKENFSFLSTGNMKAQSSELTKKPRNVAVQDGITVELQRPRKYPNEKRNAAQMNTAASAISKSDHG